MKVPLVDRIVLVHRGGRVLALRLVEGIDQHINPLVPEVGDALADVLGIHAVHGDEDLVAGVLAMQVERALKPKVNGFVHKVDRIEPDLQ